MKSKFISVDKSNKSTCFIFTELMNKTECKQYYINCDNLSESFKLMNVDEIIKPTGSFERYYDSNIYTVRKITNGNIINIVHIKKQED